jgi:hypothetical protein
LGSNSPPKHPAPYHSARLSRIAFPTYCYAIYDGTDATRSAIRYINDFDAVQHSPAHIAANLTDPETIALRVTVIGGKRWPDDFAMLLRLALLALLPRRSVGYIADGRALAHSGVISRQMGSLLHGRLHQGAPFLFGAAGQVTDFALHCRAVVEAEIGPDFAILMKIE